MSLGQLRYGDDSQLMNSVIAIIPARGGSNGIKNKNLQHVSGIPLVARTILACKQSSMVDDVYVSTDNSKIARVSKVINPANRSFTVEIELPNNEGLIRPNLMATVEINDYTSENAVLIPQSIVSENAQGQQYCFALVSENGGHVARRLLIKTGKTMGDLIEVVDGIEPGSLLITEGAKKVSDNQPVKWLN